MIKDQYLGKSNGQTIGEHINEVKDITLNLAKRILVKEIYDKYELLLIHASLLHDIGKLTDSFIKKLSKGENENNIESKLKYRHNEIGWAFLSKYYIGKNKDLLLHLVFWHHGISNNINGKSENDDAMLNDLSDVEIKRMKDFLVETIGENYLLDDNDAEDIETNKVPVYYDKNNKGLFQWKILYGCLIGGDRIASGNYDNINDELDKYFNLSSTFDPIKNWVYKGTERSNEQIDIINQCKGTTMLNAPAGFGKTTMGLLWGLKRNKKILWVAPRNTIAEFLYEGVKAELNAMNINPTIELILGGEIKKGGNGKMFDSDIIITNIDNFLSPSNNNSLLKHYSLLNGASVIFDEYHELIGDSPLFSAFILMMQGRNLMTTSETLLLSATPNIINFMWEGSLDSKKLTQILPEKGKHFKPQHQIPFKVNMGVDNDFNNIIKDKSLVIYNSITKAQIEMSSNDYPLLFHSKFIPEQREKNMGFLLSEYGKSGNATKNIVGTHILQASLDISFNNLYESVLSPEASLQRMGRLNRWGETKNCVYNCYKLNNKSESSTVKLLYDINLQGNWFDYLYDKFNGKEVILEDIYNAYNEYYEKNKKPLKRYVKQLKKNSLNTLSEKIYPIKYYNKNIKSDIITAGGNKLRSSGNEIFYIVKDKKTNEWSDVFNEQIIGDFDEFFNEDGATLTKMLKVMKKLRNSGDNRFDFNEMLDVNHFGSGVTMDKIRREARKSITPYIRFDKVYDDNLGVISINLLDSLKNN